MSVVNCKVKFIRPQYENLRDWMSDESNVYIGRAGVVFITNEASGKKERYPKVSSIFANPYKVGSDGTREEVIKKYQTYIESKLAQSPTLINELLSMQGKKLGCWCYPEPCHGDILLDLITKYQQLREKK